jgi:hypothetical protein
MVLSPGSPMYDAINVLCVGLLAACGLGLLASAGTLIVAILSRHSSDRRLGEIRYAVRARPRSVRMPAHISATVVVPVSVDRHDPITGAIDLPPALDQIQGQIDPPEEYEYGAQV